MFNVTFDDNIAELFIQFNGVADTTSLFACDERAAGATKRIGDQRVGHAGIHNQIGQKRNGLHCRMIIILFRLIKFPDGCFFSSGIPLMLTGFLPTEKATEYDDKLVRKYIEQIQIYDDKFVVCFKAKMEINVLR